MIYRQQFESSDCGPACIAMIASYFGKEFNIAKIRNIMGTDVEGSNLIAFKKIEDEYKFEIRLTEGNKEGINKNLCTPFIVHMHIIRNNNSWIDHYVVVKKITKKKDLYLRS